LNALMTIQDKIGKTKGHEFADQLKPEINIGNN